MKQTIKCLIAAFAAMLMSVAAYAQVTTAALGGRVVDANGQPIVGAAVVQLTSLQVPFTALSLTLTDVMQSTVCVPVALTR